MTDDAKNETALEDTVEETKEASVVLSYQLNLGVDMFISNHLSLRANVYSKYQLTAPYQLGSIKQNYYRIGFSLGMAYNF